MGGGGDCGIVGGGGGGCGMVGGRLRDSEGRLRDGGGGRLRDSGGEVAGWWGGGEVAGWWEGGCGIVRGGCGMVWGGGCGIVRGRLWDGGGGGLRDGGGEDQTLSDRRRAYKRYNAQSPHQPCVLPLSTDASPDCKEIVLSFGLKVLKAIFYVHYHE